MLSILSLFVKMSLSIELLKDFKDALQLYTKYLRAPAIKGLGVDSIPLASYALDGAVLWLALFLAINAFVQKIDGLFVSGHIGRGYCFRAKQTFIPLACCTLPKFIIAFLATPVVCTLAVWAHIVLGQASITMAYMTVEPKSVARYILALFGIPALIIAAWSFFTSA